MKGSKSIAIVTYMTVPLPIILVLMLLIRGSTLEGAADGIRWYLLGFPDGPTVAEHFKDPSFW